MADPKFTLQQIERYNDRIKNCLDDPICRPILAKYIQTLKKPMFLSTMKLFEAANSTTSWNESTMLGLIEDVDAFNENPLLSISECQDKLDYTKGECCKILQKVLPMFIEYLKKNHKAAGPCSS